MKEFVGAAVTNVKTDIDTFKSNVSTYWDYAKTGNIVDFTFFDGGSYNSELDPLFADDLQAIDTIIRVPLQGVSTFVWAGKHIAEKVTRFVEKCKPDVETFKTNLSTYWGYVESTDPVGLVDYVGGEYSTDGPLSGVLSGIDAFVKIPMQGLSVMKWAGTTLATKIGGFVGKLIEDGKLVITAWKGKHSEMMTHTMMT